MSAGLGREDARLVAVASAAAGVPVDCRLAKYF
jgi:hypothetical protein